MAESSRSDQKSLALAADAARAFRTIDLGAASAAARQFRDLQAKGLVDFSVATTAMKALQADGTLDRFRDTVAAMNRQNTEALSQAVGHLNERNAASMREALAGIQPNMSANWRGDMARTMERLSLPKAMNDQLTQALAALAKMPRVDLQPRFAVALAEAVELASTPEIEAVAEQVSFENLTSEQRQALQLGLLGLITQVAAFVAIFVESRRLDAAIVMMGLLAVLISTYWGVYAKKPPGD